MKKTIFASLFANAVLLLMLACSTTTGTITPPPPPPPHSQGTLHASAMAGFHAVSAKKVTAFDFSLVPTVHAQTTTTITLTGSFNGFCAETPVNFVPSTASAAVIYGGGTLDPSACGHSFNTGGDGNSPGQDAAQGAQNGQLIVGAGTIGPLVAYDAPESVHAGSTSALAEVWVIRGGTVINTGLSATLGVSNRADTVTTFPVLDGDYTVVTLTIQPGDDVKGFQYYLTKQ